MLVNHASGYIEKKKRFLMILFMKTKGYKKKYADLWDGIKNEIKAINDAKENDYKKEYRKIKFNS